MKYIIKNCPNCFSYGDDYWCEFKHFSNPCKKSDCLLKRIVDKCKDYKLITYEGEFYKLIQENMKAKEILELLDIEECE